MLILLNNLLIVFAVIILFRYFEYSFKIIFFGKYLLNRFVLKEKKVFRDGCFTISISLIDKEYEFDYLRLFIDNFN